MVFRTRDRRGTCADWSRHDVLAIASSPNGRTWCHAPDRVRGVGAAWAATAMPDASAAAEPWQSRSGTLLTARWWRGMEAGALRWITGVMWSRRGCLDQPRGAFGTRGEDGVRIHARSCRPSRLETPVGGRSRPTAMPDVVSMRRHGDGGRAGARRLHGRRRSPHVRCAGLAAPQVRAAPCPHVTSMRSSPQSSPPFGCHADTSFCCTLPGTGS